MPTHAQHQEPQVAVFALMDEWITAGGRSDAWLELGLVVMDTWQDPAAAEGQAHLQEILGELRSLRPVTQSVAAPDPLVLAAWFHHLDDGWPFQRLAELTGTAVVAEVRRLVSVVRAASPAPDDADGRLLCAAHGSWASPPREVRVPAETRDQ